MFVSLLSILMISSQRLNVVSASVGLPYRIAHLQPAPHENTMEKPPHYIPTVESLLTDEYILQYMAHLQSTIFRYFSYLSTILGSKYISKPAQ